MIVKVVEAYCSDPAHGLDISVAEHDREQIVAYFMNELKAAIHNGCTVRSDGRIAAGFRATVSKGHVSHDFTAEAIGEAMAKLLRPQLAEITRSAVAGMAKSAEKKA
jgi:V/A-type H+-transporting ATPase subunit E